VPNTKRHLLCWFRTTFKLVLAKNGFGFLFWAGAGAEAGAIALVVEAELVLNEARLWL